MKGGKGGGGSSKETSPPPSPRGQSVTARDEDAEDEAASFAGAVGFFDADAGRTRSRVESIDVGAMGFFECLDLRASKQLGVSDEVLLIDGAVSGGVPYAELVALLERNTARHKVVVRNNRLVSADLQVLAGTLIKFHQLTVIDFSGNPLGVRGVATLLDCCRGNMDLKELHLVHVIGEVGEGDVDVVCRTLEDFPSLHLLNLSSNGLSQDVLRAVALAANEHPCLNRLLLENNGVTTAGAAELLRFLAGNVELHTLNVGNLKRLRGGTGVNPLRKLKPSFRGVRGGGGGGIVEVLSHNLGLRNLQVDGLTSTESSKMTNILRQNEQLWALRSGRSLRGFVSLSHRGFTQVPELVLNLTHLLELDLSHNSLEAVPAAIVRLKGLQSLSLEKNDIAMTALPVHLLQLKKLRALTLAGNPCVAEFPPGVAADSLSGLMGLFTASTSKAIEPVMYEAQCAIVVSSEVPREAAKLAAEIERYAKRQKSGLMRLVRAPVPTTLRAALVGRLVSEEAVRAATRAAVVSPGRRTTGRLSFHRGGDSVGDSMPSLWGVMHECDPALLSAFALFHPVVVYAVDSGLSDWEARARDALAILPASPRPSRIVLVLLVQQASLVEARRLQVAPAVARLRSVGVEESVVVAGDAETSDLYAAVSQAVVAVLEGATMVSRAGMMHAISLLGGVGVTAASPGVLASAFGGGEPPRLGCDQLRWAQNAGLVSAPLPGGIVCTSLEYATGCVEAVVTLGASVFGRADLRDVFPPDGYSPAARDLALRLLEAANAVVHTGWGRDQWIVQHLLLGGADNAALPAPGGIAPRPGLPASVQLPAGATPVTRLFRILSPIVEVSEASLVRRVFLQTAGVLSDVMTASAQGFSGTLMISEQAYPVVLSIERSGGLTVVVELATDAAGCVVHMVTTAIERGLDETQLRYARLYLSAEGRECDLDREVREMVKANVRTELMARMAGARMVLLPDLLLLATDRLFWAELRVVRPLGKGSFGEVSLASVVETGQQIAVKAMRSGGDDSAAGLRGLLRELWVLSVLKHPNIVAAAGVCLDPLSVCMEYLSLGDLRAFLDRRGRSPAFGWPVRHQLLVDIASGMEYAHGRRPPLVHSDLKSPNILLCSHDGVLTAKIADLGLARFSSLNAAGGVDNPLWSAPEMIQRGLSTPSVDVYSFGIIAWEVCCGEFPFRAVLTAEFENSLPRLREAIVGGLRPDVLLVDGPDVPPYAVPLLQQCWAEEAGSRPSFRQIVARLVQAVPAAPMASIGGVRQLLPAGMMAEPKAACILGESLVALSADGLLWLFDPVTLTLVQRLRWKLAERVRAASCATLGDSAFFAFGGDSLFVLNTGMAVRRVVGSLTSCESLCVAGECLVVSGRNEAGVALQVLRRDQWEGPCWNLPARLPVSALVAVSDGEVWCICTDKEQSMVVALLLANPRNPRRSQTFPDKVHSAVCVPWAPDEVWLCGSASMLRVRRDTLEATGTIPLAVRVPLPVAAADGRSFLFACVGTTACLLDAAGAVAHRAPVTAAAKPDGDKPAEAAHALVVPGLPHVIVSWSRFGLLSWRLDTYGRCEAGLLAEAAADAASVRAAASTNGTNGPARSVGPSSGTGGGSGSGSGGKSDTERLAKSNLHMQRRALVRATVTCDDTGRIVSCNRAVAEVFGHASDALVGKSVRMLFYVPRTRDRTNSVLLYSRQTPQHFSASELWRGIVSDLLRVRVVNGQCKDGSCVPLLISSSEMLVAGKPLYVLLFEQLSRKCCIAVLDESGVVTTATDNFATVMGWTADQVSGRPITTVVISPQPRRYLLGSQYDPTVTFQATAKAPGGQTVGVQLQVIDFSNRTYTVVFSPAPVTSNGAMAAAAATGADQLSHYDLGRVLGQGMCGEVREGTHRLTGTVVAVKRLRKRDFEAAGVAFTRLELELMRTLNSPRVVRLYDALSLPEELVLVLELVRGSELFSYCLSKGPLPEAEALEYFRDIMEGVAYIHGAGVCHRDLKLENCILDESRRIKIIDFGLGNWCTNGPLKTSCGSPNYAAPELFLSRKYAGPPVDVWACGVMLFGMITGEFPFDEIQATVDGDYDWPSVVSRQLQDLVAGIFAVNPDLRATVAQCRQHPWTCQGRSPPALDAEPTSTKEPIRADLVARMESEFGMPLEIVVKSLQDGEINHFTATYKMLRHCGGSRIARGVGDLAMVQNAIKKLEVGHDLSLTSIVQRGKEKSAAAVLAPSPRGGGGDAGPKSLLRSNSGKLMESVRARSRSRSGANLAELNVRPPVGGGAAQAAWVIAKPSGANANGGGSNKSPQPSPRGGKPTAVVAGGRNGK